jgi:16S rRNA (adenine(1408)-N(1))-methyltransferase
MIGVAAAEDLPRELDGVADEVRVHFPWGSLLRGLAMAEDRIARPLARVCAPGATVTALFSIASRDGLDVVWPDGTGSVARRYAAARFATIECRPARL